MSSRRTSSKKKQVLQKLFEECQQSGQWQFDNALVKRVCADLGFGNPLDVTKMDAAENDCHQ